MDRKIIVAVILTIMLSAGSLLMYYKIAASNTPANVTYVPIESTRVLNNPYMGFAVDARYDKFAQPYRLAHANLYWRDLEPVEGRYDWEAIEEKYRFDQWREKKVNLILRVVLDYPGDSKHMDIPDWLYESIDRQGTWYDIEYGQGFSPDYSHPVLIRKHEQLIRALAERYDDDPLIAYIQLGSLGHWGEWHTRDEEPGRIEFPRRAVSDQYAEHYVDHFTNKPLLMRRPHAIALEHKMGLFNDAFGKRDATIKEFLDWYTNGYTSWLTQEPEPAMPDFWTYAPSGGEFSDETRYVTDAYIDDTILQAKLTHVTWMGPNAPYKEPLGGKLQNNIDRFLNTIGYRFVIAKETHEQTVRPGGRLHVRAAIVNRGAAPIYYRWPLEIGIVDAAGVLQSKIRSSQDIRTWLPGTRQVSVDVPVPATLPAGEYTLTAAILDPTNGQPGIDLAIEGRRSDGRYTLGSFAIVE
jgi:hypothetical protein